MFFLLISVVLGFAGKSEGKESVVRGPLKKPWRYVQEQYALLNQVMFAKKIRQERSKRHSEKLAQASQPQTEEVKA